MYLGQNPWLVKELGSTPWLNGILGFKPMTKPKCWVLSPKETTAGSWEMVECLLEAIDMSTCRTLSIMDVYLMLWSLIDVLCNLQLHCGWLGDHYAWVFFMGICFYDKKRVTYKSQPISCVRADRNPIMEFLVGRTPISGLASVEPFVWSSFRCLTLYARVDW